METTRSHLDPKPRYRWRRTWPDRPNDFIGFDGDRTIGRICLDERLPGGAKWRWFYQAWGEGIDPRYNGSVGEASSARLAAKEIEDRYDRARI